MKTMRHAASVALAAICITLFGNLPGSAEEVSASQTLKHVAGDIVSAGQELTELKANALVAFESLQRQLIDSDEQTDNWEKLAKLEDDPRMKSILYGFRDAWRSHSNELKHILERLDGLGRIGERLELNVKLLTSFQRDLEQIVEGKLAPGKAHLLLSSTTQGLNLVQQDTMVSAKTLNESEKSLSVQTSSVLDYDKKIRQVLANLGNPQNRVEKWKKQLVETDLDNNTKEAKGLATVSLLGSRIAGVLITIGNTTKALQLVTTKR